MSRRMHEMDMCSGPLLSKMIAFAIPVVVTSVLQLVFNAADMIVVGRFASEHSLASVGATTHLINLLLGFFNGVAVGGGVVVAKRYGAGDYAGVSRATHTSILLSLIVGVFIGLVGFFFTGTMLEWMDTPPEVLSGAQTYLKIYFLGVPAMMVFNFAAAVLRSVGDTRHPMYYLTFSGALNVAMNLLFVLAFKMDVAGVALATTITQYVAAALVLYCMIHADNSVRVDLKRLQLEKTSVAEILRVGVPSGIQASMFSISNVLIQSGVNRFGASTIAGNSVGASIEGFVSLGTGALYQVCLSFAGQNMGAKKYDRIDRIVRISLLLSVLIWVVMGGAVWLARMPLARLYTTDEAAVQVAAQKLTILLAAYYFIGMMNSIVGVLRGMGYALVPMVNTILGVCVFRVIWLYTFFIWYPTLTCLYLSYPISWVLVSLAHLVTYFIVRRRVFPKPGREGQAEA